MKICSKCGIEKPLDEFINDYRLKSGKGAKCVLCVFEYNKARRLNGLVKPPSEERRQYQREYDKKWAKANRHKKRESFKKWAESNPVKRKLGNMNRRFTIKNDRYEITPKEMKALRHSACAVCASKEQIEIDHIIPLAKGGRHSIGNLQALCAKCNRSKGAKFLIVFRKENNLLAKG